MEENCYVEPMYKDAISMEKMQKADRATLFVQGMSCNNCATRVRNGLLSLENVYGVDVYLNMALVEIRYDSEKVSTDHLIAAVSRAGNDGRHEYRAELVESR
jgi:copper chaperone